MGIVILSFAIGSKSKLKKHQQEMSKVLLKDHNEFLQCLTN